MSGILNALVANGGSSAAVDPYFNQTTLLLHGDGTNGAQNNTFLDSSTNNFTITRNGNTTQGTFTPFSQPDGRWSNYFDGSSYLTAPANAAFNFTGNFTIEMWVNPWSNTGSGGYSLYLGAATGSGNYFGIKGGTQYVAQFNGSGEIFWAGTPTIGAWTHLALVRNGSTVTLYVNGVSAGINTNSTTFLGSSTNIQIGAFSGGQFYTQAYISNIRLVNGTAVYTSAFTPPTSPLIAITNTSLLTCQSNRFVDNSTNAFAITASGTPSVQVFSPFAPTAAYSTTTNGGSAYFDGSGDYLATPTTGQFTATGDFTLSLWFYLTSFANTYYCPCGNWSAGTSDEWLIQIQNNGAIRFLTAADGIFSSAGAVSLNQWTYFTATRSGSTVTVQLNGTTIRTFTKSDTFGSATKSINIGQQPGGTWPWVGYIADFRLVSGSAITTVPTSPSSSSGTSFLLSATNAGILDNAKSNDFETVGNAQISTTQSKFGVSSMYFGTSGDYLYASPSKLYDLTTGQYTIEMWINFKATGGTYVILGFYGNQSGSPSGYWHFLMSSNVLYWQSNGSSTNQTTYSWTPTINTWYHLALSWDGSTFRMFINGNVVATNTSNPPYTTAQAGLCIGGRADGYFTNGYIDDLRITKYARYTANFTVPSAAFPNQ